MNVSQPGSSSQTPRYSDQEMMRNKIDAEEDIDIRIKIVAIAGFALIILGVGMAIAGILIACPPLLFSAIPIAIIGGGCLMALNDK